MDTKLLGLILQDDKRIAREITDLKNTLSDAGLTESGAIVQTAAGESIVANDASDGGVKGLRVFGKSEQFSTTGAQLFDASTLKDSTNAFVEVKDNGYEIISTANEGVSTNYPSITVGLNIALLRGKKVHIQCDEILKSSGASSCVQLIIVKADDSKSYIVIDANNRHRTSDIPSDAKQVLVGIYSNNGTTDLPENPYIKVKGLRIGFTESVYEPYTGGIPSPNPNFPQPITSAGDDGDIEVGVYGGNLFDNVWEQGSINLNTGENINNDDEIRSANYIPVAHNKEFYIKRTTIGGYLKLRLYDKNFEYLGGGDAKYYELLEGATISNPIYKTDDRCIIKITDKEVAYIRLIDTTNDLSTKYFVGLYEGNRNEPYKAKQTLPISTPNGLPGIPVTDASLATYTDAEGNMWCADEVDFERGVYVKRIGKINLEDINWTKTNYWDETPISTIKYVNSNKELGVIMAEKYRVRTASGMSRSVYGEIAVDVNNVKVNNNNNTERPSGKMFYLLKTPIETSLSKSELAAYEKLHTNCPVTTVLNDSGAHMELTYNADTKTYIDNKFTELTNAILSMGGNV